MSISHFKVSLHEDDYHRLGNTSCAVGLSNTATVQLGTRAIMALRRDNPELLEQLVDLCRQSCRARDGRHNRRRAVRGTGATEGVSHAL